MRRTFITLALTDGARKDILRWVTHSGNGDIVDLYTSIPWAARCEAVACLKLEVRASPRSCGWSGPGAPEALAVKRQALKTREGAPWLPQQSVTVSVTARPTHRDYSAIPVPREGFEGGKGTHEDLRGSAKPAESLEGTTPQAGPQGSSADQAVTGLVTVPSEALAVLVKLARRFDDDLAIAAALAAVGACRDGEGAP